MKFLMLWSGDKPGMRKGIVQGQASKGIVGHYKDGKVYIPNAAQVRELLPKRYRKPFDEQVQPGWQGLPPIWSTYPDNTAPLTIQLRYKNRKLTMLQLYFNPLPEES